MNGNWKKKFVTIAAGQAASLIGSSAVQFALIWWIASETGSAFMMGMAGLAAFLPATLLSPLAGIAADRYNRKYICVCADMFVGAVAAVFAVLLWVRPMPVWTAVVILFLRSMSSAFHSPSFQAMIPQFVPAEDLMKVGGWNQMVVSGSFLLGPAIGAALYASFPLPVVLLTDLAGALIASIMLMIVRIAPVEKTIAEKHSMIKEFKEGVQVIKADRALSVLILVETLCMVFFMPLSSFYPLMTSDYFGGSAWHGSAVEVAYALGMMAAAFLIGNVIKIRRQLFASYIGILGVGVTSALCGILPHDMWAWAAFAVLCGIMGAFANVNSIPFVAYMQATIPAEKMGRAFSLFALASSLAMPLGLLVASPLAEIIGVPMWFLISGASTVVISIAGMIIHNSLEKAEKHREQQ